MLLAYRVYGSGKPIVLLHGYLSSSHYWRHIIPHLAMQHRVIAIDVLGFGRSPKPRNDDYSIATHAECVIETIRRAVGDEPVTLVGHSMGAIIAARVANDVPNVVSKLVLCNMPIFRSIDEARESLRGTSRLYATMLYGRARHVLWPLVNAGVVAWSTVTRRSGTLSPHHTDRSRRRSLGNTIEAARAVELVAGLSCPAVILMGTLDRKEYEANLRRAQLPETVRIVWVHAGHHIPRTHPQALYDAVQ